MIQRAERSCRCTKSVSKLIRPVGVLITLILMNSVSPEADSLKPNTVAVSFVLMEETKVGTKIGNILNSLNSIPKVDCCSLLEMKPNRYLTLNASTGDLFVRSRVDRESLCGEAGVCCSSTTVNSGTLGFPVGARRFDALSNTQREKVFPDCTIRMLILQNPHDDALVEVLVYIVDLNDNTPFWHHKLLEMELPEHAPHGYVLKLPEATDMDQGPYNTVTEYKLFEADYNPENNQIVCTTCHEAGYGVKVGPDSSTNAGRSSPLTLEVQLIQSLPSSAQKFDLHLRLQDDTDREKQSEYYFILYAIDGREEHLSEVSWMKGFEITDGTTGAYNTRRTGSLTIKVNVLDINDHAPQFLDPAPVVTIAESLKPGSLVYQVKATDLDVTDQTKLVYRIDLSAVPEVHRCFRVDPVNGEVRLKCSLNRHNASILIPAELSTGNSAKTLINGAATHTLGYLIPIQVSDTLHQTSVILRVQLGQVNRYPPKIYINSHWRMSSTGDQIWVPESVSVDSIVALVNIDDQDVPTQPSFSSGPTQVTGPECFTNQGVFTIQPIFLQAATDFKLTLAHRLDREITESYVVKIECWDTGSPPLSSERSLTIYVEDIDDSPPVFDRSIYLSSIKEGVAPNSLLLRVRATDADAGANAQVFYRIVSQLEKTVHAIRSITSDSVDKFSVSIHPTSGEVYSRLVFDREVTTLINCTIEASNSANGTSDFWTSQKAERQVFRAFTQVVITIEDVNDCKPEFSAPSYEFTVLEGQAPNTQIGHVHAKDGDAETQNNFVKYSMRPVPGPLGQLAKAFIRVSPDGVIYTQSSKLDREQTPVLSFEVVATDNGTPPLSAFTSVLIRVLDVNDNSPVWLFPKRFGSHTNVNISQHATIGLQIAQLKAVDPDDGLNGEVLYSILQGNEDGIFEVDPTNGALYLTKSLHHLPYTDRELLSTHQASHSPGNGSAVLRKRLYHNDENMHLHKLVLKASDQGTPPLFNTTVLNIIVMPSSEKSNTGREYSHPSGLHSLSNHKSGQLREDLYEHRFDHDLLVIVILIALTSVISVVLIMAICLIRCKQLRSVLHPRRREVCNVDDNQKPNALCWMQPGVVAECLNGSKKETILPNHLTQNSFQELEGDGKPVHFSRYQKHSAYTPNSLDEGQNKRDTAYFTIRPEVWDMQTLLQDNQLSVADSDANRTMQSSVERHSEAFMVDTRSDELAQAYSILKCNACNPSGDPGTDYQPLNYTSHHIIKSSLKPSSASSPLTNLPSDEFAGGTLNNRQRGTPPMRCGSLGRGGHVCNRPSVQTFVRSSHSGTEEKSSVCECTPLVHLKTQRIL